MKIYIYHLSNRNYVFDGVEDVYNVEYDFSYCIFYEKHYLCLGEIGFDYSLFNSFKKLTDKELKKLNNMFDTGR